MSELVTSLFDGVPQISAAVLFMLLFFGTFVSEDAACIAAGTAVANGQIGFAMAMAVCFLGIFAGDMALYGIGRLAGDRIFDRKLVRRFVSDAARSKATSWLTNNGASAVFLSRFVTGLRLPTYLAAGALRTDARKFAAYFLLASSIWTPLLVGSAAYSQTAVFGGNIIIGVVVLFFATRIVLKYSARRNRRLLVGRIRRVTNWEFWPIQVFYAPVVFYCLWLGIKHRGLTVFTAANPAFPAGGFKGESKHEIYGLLGRSAAAAECLPLHVLIRTAESAGMRLRTAWRFMDDNGLSFPLVVKPDAGERGKGVRVVRSFDELAEAVTTTQCDLIVQQYVGGEEVSVFYYRRPNDECGRIFSITEKRFPALAGDGRSTVEQLILADKRAVAMASKYLEPRNDLDRIPDADEVVKLIDIGTHSRGAIFVDGSHLKTKQLEKRIDEICRDIDGFYFGRFDIRLPSFEALRTGDDLTIIELNGVTSESTNIYDPMYSLLDAYKILFRQWSLAFEIGAANIRLGARPASIWDLTRRVAGKTSPETDEQCASFSSPTIDTPIIR